ncbi:hypothetical protein MTO96_011735 [Rhipicephalus appendiculatus]
MILRRESLTQRYDVLPEATKIGSFSLSFTLPILSSGSIRVMTCPNAQAPPDLLSFESPYTCDSVAPPFRVTAKTPSALAKCSDADGRPSRLPNETPEGARRNRGGCLSKGRKRRVNPRPRVHHRTSSCRVDVAAAHGAHPSPL